MHHGPRGTEGGLEDSFERMIRVWQWVGPDQKVTLAEIAGNGRPSSKNSSPSFNLIPDHHLPILPLFLSLVRDILNLHSPQSMFSVSSLNAGN